MIPIALLAVAPFVATDAGLAWDAPVRTVREPGRVRLEGRAMRGEIAWFVAKRGTFSAEKLYESDTRRTKEADAAKGFAQARSTTILAGMPAIRSDQTYLWNGVPVASRCVYCVRGARAWVVRLWWPPASEGAKEAEAFLRGVRSSGL